MRSSVFNQNILCTCSTSALIFMLAVYSNISRISVELRPCCVNLCHCLIWCVPVVLFDFEHFCLRLAHRYSRCGIHRVPWKPPPFRTGCPARLTWSLHFTSNEKSSVFIQLFITPFYSIEWNEYEMFKCERKELLFLLHKLIMPPNNVSFSYNTVANSISWQHNNIRCVLYFNQSNCVGFCRQSS